jgi:aryl-alcohol dehydrogenase-like predicted oxidoreductase
MTNLDVRPLGTDDLLVTTVGLGCNNFGRAGTRTETLDGTRAVIDAVIDSGITLLDTADIYGGGGVSESLMGEALRGRRDRVILATKFGHQDFAMEGLPAVPKGSREYIRAAVEGSLRRLQTDYIDLYQIHTPDPLTPIEDTLGALDELAEEGLIRFSGTSQFDAAQVRAAEETARTLGLRRFVSTQNEYNLLERAAEDSLLPTASELGVGFLPFFPLANGLFTGKFSRSEHPEGTRLVRQKSHALDSAPWDRIEAFRSFAESRGISMLAATFGWMLAQPALTSVIAGATRPEQVRANAEASVAWRPSGDDLDEISRLFS